MIFEVYQNIEIVFEDNHLLVINKPGRMLSQGDVTGDEDVQSILKKYLKEKYKKPGNVFLALVQRLDRTVSGLMVLARTSKAASRLSQQIRNQNMEKMYLAVVESRNIPPGKLVHYLRKDENQKKAFIVDKPSRHSQKAELTVHPLQTKGSFSLIAVLLQTGRFHQIRAQLSAAGMPITGDRKYGGHASTNGTIALMCNKLSFLHPTRDEAMTFTLPLPNSPPWSRFQPITQDDLPEVESGHGTGT
ncbi:MAG: RluA family pseudouridine synthase [Balneolales bacterium]